MVLVQSHSLGIDMAIHVPRLFPSNTHSDGDYEPIEMIIAPLVKLRLETPKTQGIFLYVEFYAKYHTNYYPQNSSSWHLVFRVNDSKDFT